MTAAMERLADQGVDVTRFLTDAHKAGAGIDQAVAAVLAAAPPAATASAPAAAPAPAEVPAARTAEGRDPWVPPPAAAKAPASGPAPVPGPPPAPAPAAGAALAPTPAPEAVVVSEDARRCWGPLTEGLTLPANLDLDLGVRDKALEQLGVGPAVHAWIVSTVKDVLGERDGGLLVGARPWPLFVARRQQIGEDRGPEGCCRPPGPPDRGGALAYACARRLRPPHGPVHPQGPAPRDAPLVATTRVSVAQARSRSTTPAAALRLGGHRPGRAGHARAPPAGRAHTEVGPQQVAVPRSGNGAAGNDASCPCAGIALVRGAAVVMTGRQRRVGYGTTARSRTRSCRAAPDGCCGPGTWTRAWGCRCRPAPSSG